MGLNKSKVSHLTESERKRYQTLSTEEPYRSRLTAQTQSIKGVVRIRRRT